MEGIRRQEIWASVIAGAAAEQNVWTRSANRNNGNNTFIVNSSGNVNNNNAQNGNRCAPDRTGASPTEACGAAAERAEAGAGSRDPEPERADQCRGDADAAGTRSAAVRPGPKPQLEPGELNGVVGFLALRESARKCRRGVIWKDSTASYMLNLSERTLAMSRKLQDGTFRCGKTREFDITRPKRRTIVSVGFADRVFQRSLNDNSIYPRMVHGFIKDNAACQKDKDQYPGEVGYNPGNQMIQIAGISVLDPLDHMAKDLMGIRNYIRYMDDAVAILPTREEAERAMAAFGDTLHTLGFELNPKKSRVYPLRDGIEFLGFDFHLTDTGKALMFVKPSNVKDMRRRIRRMAWLAQTGKMYRSEVDGSYQGWRDHASKGDSFGLIRRSDAWYKGLWKE